jgi:large subunit ribosomal protein L28
MAKRCEFCGKQPHAGNKRSFSNKASKRWFKPNILKKRLEIAPGVVVKVNICSRCYKRLQREGVL